MNIPFRQTILFAAFVLPALTQTRSVIVLPAGSPSDLVNKNVTILNADTLAPIATPAVGAEAFAAFTLPNGTKSYVVAKGATGTITVLSNANDTVTFMKSIDLAAGATDAYLTPDGKRLLIVSLNDSNLTIIDTNSDLQLTKIPLSAPANTVVTNFESTRAFAASPNGAVVTAVDLVANVAIGTISIPSEITLVSGLAAAPNGLIYLSAVNRLFEIDPRTAQLTAAAAIVMTGSPGRPQFTPDGTKALMNNYTPISGGSALILADLATRTAQFTSLSGLTLDRFRVVSNTLAFGYANGSQGLYSINLSPLAIAPASIIGVPPTSSFRGFGGTSEFPDNKYLYVANDHILYKIDIATNAVVATQTLANLAGVPIATSTPSTAALAQLVAIGQQQFVASSATTLPLVVRALDAAGLPIAGASITYSTTATGVTIANPTVTTNSQGYAETTAVVPASQTTISIVATAGVGFTQVFTINVGFSNGGGGNSGSGKVAIYDGNGQIVYSNSPVNKPMRVKVTDPNGNAVPGVSVIWAISDGGGILSSTETFTDADGIAANSSYVAPLLFGFSASYLPAKISATTSVGTVTFNVIAVARYNDGSSNQIAAPLPNIFQVIPVGMPDFKGALGSTTKTAFQFKVTSQTGFQSNAGIPGIGLEASTVPAPGSLDTISSQTARCDNAPVTDSNGIVTCDLVLGGKIGSSILRLTVGGFQSYDFPLTVTQGAAKTITILSGNNQAGTAGQPLVNALKARIDDGFGNFINGTPVTWTIQSGTATLFETISTSGVGVIPDPNIPNGSVSSSGLVSTNVRLGNVPGDVKVRAAITPTNFVDFTITNGATQSTLTKVSGDAQTASVGTPFAQPLIVQVKDSLGNLALNTPVTFSGAGVILSSAVVNTGAQGRAQVNVTAGNNLGAYTITATVGSQSTTFSLNVIAAGPSIKSIVNGASFLPGLSPCAIAQLTGTNFANSVTGSVSGQNGGPLPTTLSGVSVEIGGVATPLFNVNNINGTQTLSFQVPCEQAPGAATLTLRSGSTSTTQSITVVPYSPGIFQTLDSTGRPTAVAVKADGTYVTPANPADRGEDLRIFVTGLGQASPAITSNTPGTGNQRVNGSVIVGVNNEGISASVPDTIYAPTLVGVYIVTFRLPINTTPGLNRPFVVAVQAPDGTFSFSQPAVLDIR